MNPLEITPAQFRRLTDQIARLAADYLESLESRPIHPKLSGKAVEALFRSQLPEKGLGEKAFAQLQDVVENSRAQNGRFFGYVLGSAEPVSATADLLASVLNQNVTAWRSGPAAVTIEKTVVNWLAQGIGCEKFWGSLTGGGSSANLMGLAMAREARMPANKSGCVPGGTVYASEEVHMSIPKAVGLLGIGRENLRLVPTDESYQIIPDELARAMQGDIALGKTPIAVVATSGTVNTGAIDPLAEIAEVAHRHRAWLHVDGAYGALAAIAAREKFGGLELADSVSLDAHKWLYQPLDTGCILYRDRDAARETFANTGEYARTLSQDPVEGFAFFEESLELSRRFRALRLWLSLRYHGLDAFRDAMRQDLNHAQRLTELIAEEPALELMAPVELSVVCFRFRGKRDTSDDALNGLNTSILKRIVERGRVYLSNALLRGRFCLRACIVNHRTTDADVESIVSETLAAAKETRG